MNTYVQYLLAHPEAAALVLLIVVKVLHSLTPTWNSWPSITKYLGLLLQILSGDQVKQDKPAPPPRKPA